MSIKTHLDSAIYRERISSSEKISHNKQLASRFT